MYSSFIGLESLNWFNVPSVLVRWGWSIACSSMFLYNRNPVIFMSFVKWLRTLSSCLTSETEVRQISAVENIFESQWNPGHFRCLKWFCLWERSWIPPLILKPLHMYCYFSKWNWRFLYSTHRLQGMLYILLQRHNDIYLLECSRS